MEKLYDRFGNEIKIGSMVTTAVRQGNSGGVSDGRVVGFGTRKGTGYQSGETLTTVKVKPVTRDGRMALMPVITIGKWSDRMTVVIVPTNANQHEMGS